MRGNDGGAGIADATVRLNGHHRRTAISRLRYIATWRAQVTFRRRLGETISRTLRLKASATVCWTSRMDMPREELGGIIGRPPSIWISCPELFDYGSLPLASCRLRDSWRGIFRAPFLRRSRCPRNKRLA